MKEQSIFGFTGRINVLLGDNKQLVGEVLQLNGNIVNSSFQGVKGKKALFNLLFEDIDGTLDLIYVIEPEVINDEDVNFDYEFEDLYKKMRTRFESYKKFKDLKPPSHLKLYIRPDFIKDIHGYSVGPEEFDTLVTLIKYPKVSEIYQHSDLYEYQITRSLVSLRNKKALKVGQ